MLETALNATATRDEIEKIKVTEVQPLFVKIDQEVYSISKYSACKF